MSRESNKSTKLLLGSPASEALRGPIDHSGTPEQSIFLRGNRYSSQSSSSPLGFLLPKPWKNHRITRLNCKAVFHRQTFRQSPM